MVCKQFEPDGQRVPVSLCPPPRHITASPPTKIRAGSSLQSPDRTSVTADEPTRTRSCHPESPRVTLRGVHSVGLHRRAITRTHPPREVSCRVCLLPPSPRLSSSACASPPSKPLASPLGPWFRLRQDIVESQRQGAQPSDRLLPLTNVSSRSCHAFSWLHR